MSRRRPPRDAIIPAAVPDPDERARIEQGLPRRDYYCRTCAKVAPAAVPRVPPPGWLLLTAVRVSPHDVRTTRDRYARMGVFCSTPCLAAALPHIGQISTARGATAAAPTTEGTTHDG